MHPQAGGSRGSLECAITAVADGLRAEFDQVSLRGIAENEAVAGFFRAWHADDRRGNRARPLLANIAMRF